MQTTLTKADPMSFTKPPYLERIEFVNGTKSYCRKCDSSVPFSNVGGGMVACGQGHKQHAGNLILNGMRGD